MCPYCGCDIEFKKDSYIVYGKDYGAIYICSNYPKCDSYVGCYRGTTKSLGRLANKELRKYKKLAHMYFDLLWITKKELGYKESRTQGYKWLSEKMNKTEEETHIGMFDIEECKKVIEICKPYYYNLKNKKERY